MKKILIWTGVLLLSLSSPLPAAPMTSVPGPTAAMASVATSVAVPGSSVAPGLEKVGVFAAVSGKVEAKAADQTVRSAASGQPVFLREEISTDAQGRLQILFLDQTVFTIGPNSRIVIDEFVYDPKTRDGKIRASIPKGIFRYVSGKIAAKKPSSVSVKLPTATIGFRGTIVGGEVRPDQSALVALLGPGDHNDAGERSGSFIIDGTGAGGGGQQEVSRTGFGVEAGSDGSLSGVFQLSDTQLNGLTAGLSPFGSEGGTGSGGSATDTSGETNAITGQNTGSVGGLTTLLDNNNDASTSAAQYAAASSAVADGVTQAEQLSRITTGQYHYAGFGAGAFTTATSSYDMTVAIDIDFGAKTIGGQNSKVSLSSGSTPIDIPVGPHSFNEVTGNAVFTDNSVANYTTHIKLMNSEGVIANSASVQEVYSSENFSGSGVVSASRTAGSA